MASEAFLVDHFFVVKTQIGQMAGGALSSENRVRGGQASCGVDAAIAANGIPRNPQDRDRRGNDGKQKSPAPQWTRPFEVVEIDPLREFLGCACSRQEC
jgi:hypothetical protein